MTRQLIDRPGTSHCKALDRMIVEFSKYLGVFELDVCLEFIEKIKDSKWDVNWSEEDAATQMKLMLGNERYKELKIQWGKDNQHLLKNTGVTKYKRISDNSLWDGLDPEDILTDYVVIYA
jgi:hypothetical protein